MNNFQKEGSISNAHAGREFELVAKVELQRNLSAILESEFALKVGISEVNKKQHRFDLGSHDPKVLVECKSHTWTSGGNVPSAKMNDWRMSMYYFHMVTLDAKYDEYRLIFYVEKSIRANNSETLAAYFFRVHGYLVPARVEIVEYDRVTNSSSIVKAKCI